MMSLSSASSLLQLRLQLGMLQLLFLETHLGAWPTFALVSSLKLDNSKVRLTVCESMSQIVCMLLSADSM